MRDLRSYTLSPKVQLHHLTPLQKQISDVLLHDEEGLLLRQRLLQGDPTVIGDIVAKHRELNSGPRYHKNFLLCHFDLLYTYFLFFLMYSLHKKKVALMKAMNFYFVLLP